MIKARVKNSRNSHKESVADPQILKSGGGRQFISPIVIYRKCTQWTFTRKKADFLEKKILGQ